MRSAIFLLFLALVLQGCSSSQAPESAPEETAATAPVKYGDNPAAGHTFTHDGIDFYYEVYGEGEPLLLVHADGLSIGSFRQQIDYFRDRYQVIAMDSRAQGKSGDGPGKIDYEIMTDDQAALLDHLGVGPVHVLGWSDGGIEALLLGIRHPEKVDKLAVMAANLNPAGLRPEALDMIHEMLRTAEASDTPQSKRDAKLAQMMLDEPHIQPEALEAITAPTLVMASDHDVISDEHTLEIYHHLPNGELCIFPNATHAVAYDDPVLFNSTVERFFETPYVKKDRIQDLLSSFEKIAAEQ